MMLFRLSFHILGYPKKPASHVLFESEGERLPVNLHALSLQHIFGWARSRIGVLEKAMPNW